MFRLSGKSIEAAEPSFNRTGSPVWRMLASGGVALRRACRLVCIGTPWH